MDYDRLNKFLGVSDENLEKIKDFFYNISRLNIKLTKEEKTLCKSFEIDEALAKIIKSNNISKIRLLPSVDEYGKIDFDNPADGICVFYILKNAGSESELNQVIYRNKQKYLSKGYNLFYFEGNKNHEYYMALVKNKTDIDILKWRRTDGINHGILIHQN